MIRFNLFEAAVLHKDKKAPSSMTTAWYEAHGLMVDVAERTLGHRVKKDLFGFCDLVAVGPPTQRDGELELHFIGVQVTEGGHLGPRVKKILAEPRASRWLVAGGDIHIWDWRRRKRQGGKWIPEIVVLKAAAHDSFFPPKWPLNAADFTKEPFDYKRRLMTGR